MKAKPRSSFNVKSYLGTAGKARTMGSYEIGQDIFHQRERADAVFHIKSGKVKVTVVSAEGKEAIIAFASANEFIGENCLIGQQLRLSTATALTKCEIMRLEKPELVRTMLDEPKLAKLFISHMLTRQARVEADLVDQLFNSTERRLARVLLLLANFGKVGRPEPVVAKINHQMLADRIGCTRSRVTHFMNKFRKLGFIDYNGHLEVHSSLLSVVIYDQPLSVTPPVGIPMPAPKGYE
jgi:CRP/FNR family transcriptional regulator, cyclic AMP receptor protein